MSKADLLKGSNYDYGLRNYLTSTTERENDITYGRFLDELGWEFNQEARGRSNMIRFGAFTKNHACLIHPLVIIGRSYRYPELRLPKIQILFKIPDINNSLKSLS